MSRSAPPSLSHSSNVLFSFTPKASYSLAPSVSRSHSLRRRPPLSYSLSLLTPPPPCCRLPRVSTAPVEYEPPAPEFDFRSEIERLTALRSRLAGASSIGQKLSVISADSRVRELFGSRSSGGLAGALGAVDLDEHELFLIKCLVAAGQEHVLGAEVGVREGEFRESAKSSLKSALYALVEMIEGLDVNGGERKMGVGSEDEEIGDLKKLLRTLGEIEQFYDCIGGIVG